MTIQLTGIANDDPTPRTAREFDYAQGPATGASNGRPILLVANKTSAGTETVETIGQPIQDLQDCYNRFGRRSEMAWGYRTLIMTAPNATIYGVANAEGGSATAATIIWTFAATSGSSATSQSTVSIQWGTKNLQVAINVGDTPSTIATNVAAKINADPDVPFSASPSAGAVTVTASNLGPRGDFILFRLRVLLLQAVNISATSSAFTNGTVADSIANANTAVAVRGDIYYHVTSQTQATTLITGESYVAPTATDGSVGQYTTFIRAQSQPFPGFDCQLFFGLDCSQAEATNTATASSTNAVRVAFFHVRGNDWTPFMVACHCAGVKWTKEQAYPAASLRGYTNSDSTPFAIPPPYVSTNRWSATDIRNDLNNGVTPIDFTSNGAAVIPRQITSYSVLPGTSNKDYRARAGHIPSVEDAAWEYIEQRWLAIRQDMVTSDPPEGSRPLKGFNTPGHMISLMNSAIDILSGNSSPWGMAILDPGAIDEMKASVYVEERAAGFGVAVNWQPARHDYQDDFLILQGGPAY